MTTAPLPIRYSHHLATSRRAGFTLVELLVSVTILALMSSMILFGMISAQKMAKVQRAKSQIARLHEIIAQRWEEIETLRMPPPHTSVVPSWYATLWQSKWRRPGSPTLTHWYAFDRLRKLRETLRMELPDRASDIRYPPSPPGSGVGAIGAPPPQPSDTGARYTANARYYFNVVTRNNKSDWGERFADSECLYMIVSRIEIGEANGLEFFGQKEIGDKDGDGMPEIWDPWNNPIRFIRWPVGFGVQGSNQSTLQIVPDANIVAVSGVDRTTFPGDAFDPLDADGGAFFHFSLVYSEGPDEISDIAHAPTDQTAWGPKQYAASPSDPNVDYPFVEFSAGNGDKWMIGNTNGDGESQERNYMDNIHNHNVETGTK
jgi:prepilin-type N-terminal cleavage/methylation domain-containing protein